MEIGKSVSLEKGYQKGWAALSGRRKVQLREILEVSNERLPEVLESPPWVGIFQQS
jgi:hypothetical protein